MGATFPASEGPEAAGYPHQENEEEAVAHPADSELVLAAQTGEMEAFEELYRRYFERVYDFAARTMRDRHQAADAVQDAFIKAHERIGQLRNPEAFRAWLYAIVRREVLAEYRSQSREAPVSTLEDQESAGLNPLLSQVSDQVYDDPALTAELADSAALVWEAAASLDTDTYAMLDLHVRQGLSSAEIADVLGISKGNAYTKLSRMKERTGSAISTYLLIRKGTKDCDGLSGIVASAELPPVTEPLRRSVDRHVRNCDICDGRRKALVAPMKIFAALAAVPPPQGLEATIWERVSGSSMGAATPPTRRPWRVLTLVAVFVALLGLASGVVAGLVGQNEPSAAISESPDGDDGSVPAIESAPQPPDDDGFPPGSDDALGSREEPVEASPVTTLAASPSSDTTTSAPTTTAAPTTTSSTVTLPDTTPPSIAPASSSPGEIWELDEDFLSCPPNSARISEITAVVSDGGSGVVIVEASWTIGSASTTLPMMLVDGVYTANFGPFNYLSVPDKTSPSIVIVITARDGAGNESKASVNVVVNSLGTCFD